MDVRQNPVDDYIQSFPEATQRALAQVREIINKLAPQAEEAISYAIPAYKLNGKPLVYFAGYTKHIGLYAIPTNHEKFAARLSKYKQGKVSVRFPVSEPMPLELIAAIVSFRIREISENKK